MDSSGGELRYDDVRDGDHNLRLWSAVPRAESVLRKNDPRSQRPVSFGTGTVNIPIAAAAPRKPSTTRIFITRVSREVNPSDLMKYVRTFSEKMKQVIKLKNRSGFPTFCSFVIETDKDEGSLVTNPERWPAGVALRTFHGVPRADQIETIIVREEPDEQTSKMEEMDTLVGDSDAGDC